MTNTIGTEAQADTTLFTSYRSQKSVIQACIEEMMEQNSIITSTIPPERTLSPVNTLNRFQKPVINLLGNTPFQASEE